MSTNKNIYINWRRSLLGLVVASASLLFLVAPEAAHAANPQECKDHRVSANINQTITVTLLCADLIDNNYPLTYTFTEVPGVSQGVIQVNSVTVNQNDTKDANAPGSLVVTVIPATDYTGPLNFTYTVEDSWGSTDMNDYKVSVDVGTYYDSSLKLYWPLDDQVTQNNATVADFSGNNRDGRLQLDGSQTGSLRNWRDANPPFNNHEGSYGGFTNLGHAEFPYPSGGGYNGVESTHDLATIGLADSSGNQEFTISLWFKIWGSGQYVLFSDSDNADSNGEFIQAWTDQMWDNMCMCNVLKLKFGTGFDIMHPHNEKWQVEHPFTLNQNQWYHAAFRYDGNDLGIILDGNDKRSEPVGAGKGLKNTDNNNVFQLGWNSDFKMDMGSWPYDNYWDGEMDDVRIYTRALSDQEVERLSDDDRNMHNGQVPGLIADLTGPETPPTLDLDPGSDSGSTGDGVTNDNTPTISGTSEDGSTVTIENTTTNTVLTTLIASGGTYSYTLSALSDDTHRFEATASDANGNDAASPSDELAITVDTVDPASPATAPSLDASSDSGSSSSDRLTNDTTPTFTGTVENNVKVDLESNVGPGWVPTGASATSDSGTGAYSVTVGSPITTQGFMNFRIIVTDIAGNSAPAGSPSVEVTFDTNGPGGYPSALDLAAATDTSTDNDDYTSETQLVISGTSSLNADVRVFTSVIGGAYGQEVATTTANASGLWTVITSPLSGSNAGVTHGITAKEADPAGNLGPASGTLSVTVDNGIATPSAPDLAAGSDSGTSSTDNNTSDTTPDFSGGSSSVEATSTVSLYEGGTLLGTSTSSGAGAWSITSSALSGSNAGTAHSVYITGEDKAGNIATSSSLSVTVDTGIDVPAAPDLDSASDSGSSSTDNNTSDQTPTVSGSAETSSTVVLYLGSTSKGSDTAHASTGAWGITSSTLSASALKGDSHSLTVLATDVAGNISATSSALSVTIDTTAPAVSSAPDLATTSDSGTNTDNITNDSTPTIEGTAETDTLVTLIDDGSTTVGTTTSHSSTGAWSITSTALSAPALAGTSHTLWTTVTDTAGNTNGTSTTLTITVDTTSPATTSAPDLTTDTGSSSTDNVTTVRTVNLSGTAEANSTVTLYLNGSADNSTTTSAGGDWNITSTSQTDASYTVTAKATDLAANTSDASTGLVVYVDNAAPVVVAPLAQMGVEGASFDLSATFSDASPQSQSRTASIDWGDGSAVEAGTIAFSSGSGTVTGSHAYTDDGAFTVTVEVTDQEAMDDTDSTTVTLSNAVPGIIDPSDSTLDSSTNVVASVVFSDPSVTDTHTATIDWNDGSAVEAMTVRPSTRTAEASHQYSAAGTYTATVTVTDDDGGSASQDVVYTVSYAGATVHIPSTNQWGLIIIALGLVAAIFYSRRRVFVKNLD